MTMYYNAVTFNILVVDVFLYIRQKISLIETNRVDMAQEFHVKFPRKALKLYQVMLNYQICQASIS